MKTSKKSTALDLYINNINLFVRDSFTYPRYSRNDFRFQFNAMSKKEHKTQREEALSAIIEYAGFLRRDGFPPAPDPIIFKWVIEAIILIPSIIFFPFFRTLIDLNTRKPIPEDEYESLCNKFNELSTNDPVFIDEVINNMGSLDVRKYRSNESKDLINNIMFINLKQKYEPALCILEAANALDLVSKSFDGDGHSCFTRLFFGIVEGIFLTKNRKRSDLISMSTDPNVMSSKDLTELTSNKPCYLLFNSEMYFIDCNQSLMKLELKSAMPDELKFPVEKNKKKFATMAQLDKITSLTGHSVKISSGKLSPIQSKRLDCAIKKDARFDNFFTKDEAGSYKTICYELNNEQNDVYKQEKIKFIQDYLKNPVNNGKNLMLNIRSTVENYLNRPDNKNEINRNTL